MSRINQDRSARLPAGRASVHKLSMRPMALAVHIAFAGGVMAAMSWSADVQAQAGNNAARQYSIPAGPLSAALTQFSADAGIFLVGASELAQGKQSSGVRGKYGVNEALGQLLSGTGIEAYLRPDGSYGLRKLPQGSTTLPEVTVSAKLPDESAYGAVVGYSARRSATATKTDTPLRETPVSVQVIPREVLEDQAAMNLKDAYENVSGVQTSGNTLNAQSEVLPYIRGFESSILMRNGLRATTAGAVDMVNIERVEVLKGPASILYGALEPGGIVNYVTKRPQAESRHVIEQQFGSYDFLRTSIDSTGKIDKNGAALYRVNFAHTDSDSFRNAMHLERTAIAPSVLLNISPSTELLLDVSYVKEKQPYDSGIPLYANGRPRASRSAFFNDPRLAGRENEDLYVGYQLTHELASGWTLRNQLQFHRAQNNNETLRPRGITGNNLQMRYQNEDKRDDETQFVVDATGKFSTGGIDHTLLLGMEYIQQETDWRRFRVNTPNIAITDNPVVSYTPPTNQPMPLEQSKTQWASFYVQDQMSLLESKRLKLLIGGRFDDVKTESRTDGLTTSPTVSDSAFTGRAGLLYQLTQSHSAYFSASQSFRPQNAGVLDANRAPLSPERGKQIEAGLKSGFLDDRLLTTVSVYKIEKDNVAVFDQNLFNLTGQNAYFPGVRQQSRGIEFDITGQLTSQLKVIASYGYTDTKVLENAGAPLQVGGPMPGIAPQAGKVWLAYEFSRSGPLSGLGIGGGIRHVGQASAQGDVNLKLDSYTVTDIGAWYNWKNVRVSLNVKNLFDEDYIARASTIAIAHPGAPRTLIGSVSIGF